MAWDWICISTGREYLLESEESPGNEVPCSSWFSPSEDGEASSSDALSEDASSDEVSLEEASLDPWEALEEGSSAIKGRLNAEHSINSDRKTANFLIFKFIPFPAAERKKTAVLRRNLSQPLEIMVILKPLLTRLMR